uniref:Uncharacterized protein n=1 Tax=Vespula pensylvanica TaxID=30213 RepID=A0A834P3P7_VESPE|nr:hypothetical protein H0235_006939 [Vespula pensylvanica]
MNRFKNNMQKFAGSELSALWAPIWLTKPMIHVCAACCKEQHRMCGMRDRTWDISPIYEISKREFYFFVKFSSDLVNDPVRLSYDVIICHPQYYDLRLSTQPILQACMLYAALDELKGDTSDEIHMILDKSSIRLKTIQNVIAQKWPFSGQAWSLVGRYADTTFAPTTTES